jgi:hypothetical protein
MDYRIFPKNGHSFNLAYATNMYNYVENLFKNVILNRSR